MQFDAEKFQALRYQCLKLNIKLTRDAAPQAFAIPGPKSVRDLNIDMSDNTFFQVHITRIAIKCRRLTGGILRAFRIRMKETMMVL